MRKKQYIAIAQAIKENTVPNYELGISLDVLDLKFIEKLCDILQADNKNFQADKFKEACK